MPQVIQCPQCDKKFRLPDTPPATFTCTQCGTLMDLSDFGGAPPAAAKPAPAAPAAPAGGSRKRRSGAGSRRAAAPPSDPAPHKHHKRRRRTRGRSPRQEVHEDETGERHVYRRKSNNNALIIGSVIAFVAAIILIAIAMKKDDEGDTKKTNAAGVSADPDAGVKDLKGAKAGSDWKAKMGLNPDGTPMEELTADGVPRKKRQKRIRLGALKLKTFPWPEEVDAETRAKVEEAIVGLYRGGRDSLDAVEYLEGVGRPICGRLISEFKNLKDEGGFENMEVKSKLGTIDETLRKIDGWIERQWHENRVIKPHSMPSFVTGIAKRWTYWWEMDVWKDKPMKPWDPMEDESDETEDGRKPPESKKKKKSGYSKRAGG